MPWRYYPSDRQFFPLGRSGERGWTSLATCWLHSSVPDGKAQVLWGVKWSVKERNGIAKEAALTLKSSKSVMHCVGPAPKAQEISATPLISSLVVWLLISCDCGPQVHHSGGWDWPLTLLGHGAGSGTPCPVRQRVPPLWVSTQEETWLLESAQGVGYNQGLGLW